MGVLPCSCLTLTKSHSHTSQLHTESTENKSIHQAIKEGYTQTRHPVRVCVIQGFCPFHPSCRISIDLNISFLFVESIVMYLSDTPLFSLFSLTRYYQLHWSQRTWYSFIFLYCFLFSTSLIFPFGICYSFFLLTLYLTCFSSSQVEDKVIDLRVSLVPNSCLVL